MIPTNQHPHTATTMSVPNGHLTDLDGLARLLHGSLHHPGEPGFAEAAQAWNVAVANHPVAIVDAADADDVSAALTWAGRTGTTVTVQCSGHGAVPQGPTLQVNTRDLRELSITDHGHVRAGAGVRWREVIDGAAARGFVPVAGAAPSVGVVGFLTGGGIGPMSRTFGVGSDYVTAFDVITADGTQHRATPTQDADLFWGLRGGKGTLGIVTAVEFDLVELDEFYGGCLYFDGADAARVLTTWRDWTRGLPEAATTSIAIMRMPAMPGVPEPLAGQVTVAVRLAWVGSSAEGERVAAPLLDAGRVVLGAYDRLPGAALGKIHNDPADPMPIFDRSCQLVALDDDAIASILALAGPDAECPQLIVEVRQLGGAIGRPRRGDSAYSHRVAGFCLTTIGLAAPPVVAATTAHADALMAALAAQSDGTSQPNFGAATSPDQLAAKYDEQTLARLQRLSARLDPQRILAESNRLHAAASPG